MNMSKEALCAAVQRKPSPWQVKPVEISTSERRIDFKAECSAQRWLKPESCGEALSRGTPAKKRREASLNQESAEGRAHAGVRANSVAVLAL